MTKQVTQMAGAVAAATSRRGFLGRLARLAGGVAAVAAGFLASTSAQAWPRNGPKAGKPNEKILCCWYIRPDFLEFTKCYRSRDTCPEQVKYGRLWGQYWGQTEVSDCKDCRIP